MTAQTTAEVVLDAAAIMALPEEEIPSGGGGVHHRLLWRDGVAYAGRMSLKPGARLPAHTHHGMAHHLWVVEGDALVLGRTLGPGSYCHVPAGVDHAIGAGDRGCAVVYLYVRDA